MWFGENKEYMIYMRHGSVHTRYCDCTKSEKKANTQQGLERRLGFHEVFWCHENR